MFWKCCEHNNVKVVFNTNGIPNPTYANGIPLNTMPLSFDTLNTSMFANQFKFKIVSISHAAAHAH